MFKLGSIRWKHNVIWQQHSSPIKDKLSQIFFLPKIIQKSKPGSIVATYNLLGPIEVLLERSHWIILWLHGPLAYLDSSLGHDGSASNAVLSLMDHVHAAYKNFADQKILLSPSFYWSALDEYQWGEQIRRNDSAKIVSKPLEAKAFVWLKIELN